MTGSEMQGIGNNPYHCSTISRNNTLSDYDCHLISWFLRNQVKKRGSINSNIDISSYVCVVAL